MGTKSTYRRRLALQSLEMSKQIVEGISLDVDEISFVLEYSIDHDHRRAAANIGLNAAQGVAMLNDARIVSAIKIVHHNAMQPSDLTPEVVKEEMFNLFNVALKSGNLSEAGRNLDRLAKHSHIDAYAAQKVAVSADNEVAQALSAGRRRVAASKLDADIELSSLSVPEFM